MRQRHLAMVLATFVWAAQGCATVPDRQATVDAVVAGPRQFRVLLENEQVRVIEYAIDPGQRDPWHTHPPKVSYVVSGGQLRIHLQNGEAIDVTEETGSAHWAEHLPVHSAENIGQTPVRILLVELKAADR